MNDPPFWKGQEEVVISGVSGRFPQSSNVEEFAEHLLNGDDLVTEDDKRWPPGIYDLPKRHGKLKELHKFDASFFGVTPKQANHMDPQVRKLLEVTWEAILDSGYSPADFRGTRTGVFVGCSGSESGSALSRDPEKIIGYSLIGSVSCMFSNWISYALDLQGPSFSVDSACSSSLLALNLALDAIRQGQCNAAIVAGTNLNLSPMTALQFWRLGMLSPAGSCRSFDESADGYCRTEGIAAILIQRKSAARRIYFTVVHAKSDTDGYKEEGVAFPSGDRQAELLREVYAEAEIDPNSVVYVETHGTGTKVGDPQEAKAIAEVFCSNRTSPLLIGSVKSNMGHAEPAAGVCALTKLIIAREKGVIPPNLHHKNPNPNIPSLHDGRLKVVTEKAKFPGGIIGINSFGFGGSKTHVILRAESKENKSENCENNELKLFLYAGRTLDGLKQILQYVQENPSSHYFRQLLSNQANLPIKDAPYRGLLIFNRPTANLPPIVEIQKAKSGERRPIWFVYTGIGSQWSGMAKQLLALPEFEASIRKSSKVVEEQGKNVYEMLQNPNPEQYKNNPTNCMITIAAIQIALTDILHKMGIFPDGIIGHSFGETCCAYADSALTREQAMQLAYCRGSTIMAQKYPVEGGMAAVGLTWEAAKEKCPKGVVPACHNGEESVTISGEVEKVQEFCDQLQNEGIFTQLVDCSGIPFHSPYLYAVKEPMLENMNKIMPTPKRRSSKWISSSLAEDRWQEEIGLYCSAEYMTNNVCNEVLFVEALQHIPPNSIVIEIAPHCLMQAILKRNLPSDCSNIGLMNKHAENEIEWFFKAIGRIYQAGAVVHAEKLHHELPLPVPTSTPMIAPLWKWDHSQDWYVVNAKKMITENCCATYDVDPFSFDTKEGFMLDHVVGGRLLYPFTGFIVLAWRAICKFSGTNYLATSVVLENFVVHRAVFITRSTQ
uniref:Fatty acid synthase n=1 Tax=Acrobeloides nanus TaxID=290746 RepID=A0A914DXV9_9BILA